MNRVHYDSHQLDELVLQMMETEQVGERVYRAALACAHHPALRKEWQGYLKDSQAHQGVVRRMCHALGLDPDAPTAARAVARQLGNTWVQAIETAQRTCDPDTAQRIACECVLHTETSNHAQWELLGRVARVAVGDVGQTLKAAHKAVEKNEEHHLHHIQGWHRELAIQALGLPAVLPPPEAGKKIGHGLGSAPRAESQVALH
ncbi:hypothetical protein [Acidovorax sp. Q11]